MNNLKTKLLKSLLATAKFICKFKIIKKPVNFILKSSPRLSHLLYRLLPVNAKELTAWEKREKQFLLPTDDYLVNPEFITDTFISKPPMADKTGLISSINDAMQLAMKAELKS